MTNKLIILLCYIIGFSCGAQNYFGGGFRTVTYTYDDDPYLIYDFTSVYDSTSIIKVKYFGQDAYTQFLKFKEDKDIVLATTASFSSSMIFTGVPVGICSENGDILNKMPSKIMDALVVLFDDKETKGSFVIGDLDATDVNFEPHNTFDYKLNPRDKILDTYSFFTLVENENLSVFQTQLLYSYKNPEVNYFKDINYGANDRNRRFLVLAKKGGSIHNVIVDTPINDYLMNAAKNAKTVLEMDGFEVLYLLNLDTGCKDILHVYNGKSLENMRPNQAIRSGTIEHASNLLVYYKDK